MNGIIPYVAFVTGFFHLAPCFQVSAMLSYESALYSFFKKKYLFSFVYLAVPGVSRGMGDLVP